MSDLEEYRGLLRRALMHWCMSECCFPEEDAYECTDKVLNMVYNQKEEIA